MLLCDYLRCESHGEQPGTEGSSSIVQAVDVCSKVVVPNFDRAMKVAYWSFWSLFIERVEWSCRCRVLKLIDAVLSFMDSFS